MHKTRYVNRRDGIELTGVATTQYVVSYYLVVNVRSCFHKSGLVTVNVNWIDIESKTLSCGTNWQSFGPLFANIHS